VTGLRDLGWILDRNIAIDFRYGAGDAERNRVFAKELVALEPDVIFVNSTSATTAVQRETKTIPVVFATVSDPVGSGFCGQSGAARRQYYRLRQCRGIDRREVAGAAERGCARYQRRRLDVQPNTATYSEYYSKPFGAAAEAAGVRHFSLPVSTVGDIAQAFATRKPDEGIVLMSDPFLTVNSAVANERALQYRVPVVSGISRSGALISYAPDTDDLFRRSAAYVDKILRGASPADLPVQLPTKFDLVVNLKTAKTLGLSVPETLIAVADEVIE
jgi:putative ABC transport system substrate-binding protein